MWYPKNKKTNKTKNKSKNEKKIINKEKKTLVESRTWTIYTVGS